MLQITNKSNMRERGSAHDEVPAPVPWPTCRPGMYPGISNVKGMWVYVCVCVCLRYLTNNCLFSTANGLQPPLAQYSWTLRNAIKVTGVVSSLVARTKLAIRKAACCRHDSRTDRPTCEREEIKTELKRNNH